MTVYYEYTWQRTANDYESLDKCTSLIFASAPEVDTFKNPVNRNLGSKTRLCAQIMSLCKGQPVIRQ